MVMRYCSKFNMYCEYANENGYCSSTACINFSNTEDIVSNNKLQEGLYIEVFAIKDGIRYNSKIINIRDLSTILTGSLMNGIEKLIK